MMANAADWSVITKVPMVIMPLAGSHKRDRKHMRTINYIQEIVESIN